MWTRIYRVYVVKYVLCDIEFVFESRLTLRLLQVDFILLTDILVLWRFLSVWFPVVRGLVYCSTCWPLVFTYYLVGRFRFYRYQQRTNRGRTVVKNSLPVACI